MSNLYETNADIHTIVETLEEAGFDLSLTEWGYEANRSPGSSVAIYQAGANDPLFDFRESSEEECDDCVVMFDLTLAQRFT